MKCSSGLKWVKLIRNRKLIFQLDSTNFLLNVIFKCCLQGQRKCFMQKVFLFTPWKTSENSKIFVMFLEGIGIFHSEKIVQVELLTLYLAIQHCNLSWIVAFVIFLSFFCQGQMRKNTVNLLKICIFVKHWMRKQTITIHILYNISRSKRNRTIK